MIFKSEEEAYDAYNLYAYRKGFGVRRGHKYFNRKGELRRCTFLCCCEGSGSDLLPYEPKRFGATPRCGCQASIKFKIEDGIWEVIEFSPVHNHAFLGDEQKHLIRSSRKIAEARSDFLNSNLDIAKRVPKAHSYLPNVSKGTQTSESFLIIKSLNKIDAADCQLLLKHMFSQQLHESNFHFSIQVDDQNKLTNFFWCDGLSRQDYECFGDVIVFDTTYRTNKYNIVCAMFFGVNHHLKSVSFGCAFLSDETADSFSWVFQTFLEAMGNEAPKTIFTGQDHAIAIAAQKVFPQTNHCLCIAQIEKNSSNYIANLLAKPGFRDKCFTKFLHGCESEGELDKTWKQMCSDWDLAENKWLKDLYHLRANWSSALMRDTFSANLEFLPRPSIFQHASCKLMSLVELVVHYDKKVEKIRETELSSDADCARGNPRILVQESGILKHAANLYTHAIFKKFQDEFLQSITERVISSNADGSLRTYILKNEDGEREHIVNFNSSDQTISCSCKLFESKGWLCRHALCILNSKENIYYIPRQYILKRWTKCAKEGFLSSDHALNFVKSSKKLRVNRLMQKAFGIISLCAERVDTVGIAIRSLELLEAEVRAQKEALGKCLDGKTVMEEDDSDTSDSGEDKTGANSRRAEAKRKKRKTKEMIESPQSDEDPLLLCSTVPTHANSVTNTNLATNPAHPQDSTFPVNINSVRNPAFSKNANLYTSPVYTNQAGNFTPDVAINLTFTSYCTSHNLSL